MVNKLLDVVEQDIGRGIHPYVRLPDGEAGEAAEYFLEDLGYLNSDNIVFHGAPTDEEDWQRFEMLERVAFKLYAEGENPTINFPEDQRSKVENSEVLHADVVNYLSPSNTEDDISQSEEGTRIHITSDYHAEAVDQLSMMYDSEDYIVVSAETDPTLGQEMKEVVRNFYNQMIDPRF